MKILQLFIIVVLISCSGNVKSEHDSKDSMIKTNETTSLSNKSLNEEELPKNYKSILDSVFAILSKKEKLDSNLVVKSIPRSNEDFHIFYSYTNDKTNALFYVLDKKIYETAEANFKNCFLLYLNMSEFVNGEYAVPYYEDVNDIITTNVDLFCRSYQDLSKVAKTKFSKDQKQYCK